MNILIVQDQGIGNMVMLTPAIRAIKEVCPEVSITVMGKPMSLEVVNGWELVDEVTCGRTDCHYDLCFLSLWSDEFMARYGDWLKSACDEIIKPELPKVWDWHEAEVNLDIARKMGYEGELPETYCQSTDWNLKFPEASPIVGLSDTGAVGYEMKKWRYYPQLAKMLIDKGFIPWVFGGEHELKTFNPNEYPEKGWVNFVGQIDNIPDLAGMIKNCDIFIGNDSGPTHIAAAMGVPTVAIFGPTLTVKNRPLGRKRDKERGRDKGIIGQEDNVKIIRKNLPCVPCQYTQRWQKCRDRACMNSISPADVMAITLDEYDPLEYWQERHDRFGMDMRGVGNTSLSDRDNMRMYKAAEKVIRGLLAGRDIPNSRILDIGCGNGYYARMYQKMGCGDYTGIDITDALFPELGEIFPEYKFCLADVTYKPGDETLEHWASDLPGWKPGLTESYLYDRWAIKCKADIIQMLDVTQHIVDDHRFFQAMDNIKAAMKSGGVFIVTDWLMDCKTYNTPYEVTRPLSYYQRAFPSRGMGDFPHEGYEISKPIRYRDKWAFSICDF